MTLPSDWFINMKDNMLIKDNLKTLKIEKNRNKLSSTTSSDEDEDKIAPLKLNIPESDDEDDNPKDPDKNVEDTNCLLNQLKQLSLNPKLREAQKPSLYSFQICESSDDANSSTTPQSVSDDDEDVDPGDLVSKGPDRPKISCARYNPCYVRTREYHPALSTYESHTDTGALPPGPSQLPDFDTLNPPSLDDIDDTPSYLEPFDFDLFQYFSKEQIGEVLKIIEQNEKPHLEPQPGRVQPEISLESQSYISYQSPTSDYGSCDMSEPSCSPYRSPDGRARSKSNDSESGIDSPISFNSTWAPLPKQRALKPISPVVINEAQMKEPAGDRMYEAFKVANLTKQVQINWIKVVMYSKKLEDIDENNNTALHSLLKESPREDFFEVRVYVMLKLMKKVPKLAKFFLHADQEWGRPIDLAALTLPDLPLISRLIADSMADLNLPTDEADHLGDTLLHKLARLGDSHAVVLAELLHAKSPKGSPSWDLNRTNAMNQTPLHVACQAHGPQHSCTSAIELLVTHGTRIQIQDLNKMTPLMVLIKHSADPKAVRILTQSRYIGDAINLTDSNKRSALHYVMKLNDLTLNAQRQIVDYLVVPGTKKSIRDSDGRLALDYICDDRKDEIKAILYK